MHLCTRQHLARIGIDAHTPYTIEHVQRTSETNRDDDPKQYHLVCLGTTYRITVATIPPLAHVASSLGYESDRNNDAASTIYGQKNPKTNRRKGELRASSPFPLGGCSSLPRTGGIPQPLEARPYGQTMPAHLRVRHLDLAVRRTCAQLFDAIEIINAKMRDNIGNIPDSAHHAVVGTGCNLNAIVHKLLESLQAIRRHLSSRHVAPRYSPFSACESLPRSAVALLQGRRCA